MSNIRSRFVLWAVLAAAGCVCMVVFPAFEHFITGIRWELGLITGLGLGRAWAKGRRP